MVVYLLHGLRIFGVGGLSDYVFRYCFERGVVRVLEQEVRRTENPQFGYWSVSESSEYQLIRERCVEKSKMVPRQPTTLKTAEERRERARISQEKRARNYY